MNSVTQKPQKNQIRQVKKRYFAIILVPVAIFMSHSFITDNMIAADLNVPADILQEGRHWLEAAGRYKFLAATWFYACLTVLAVALLVRNLARPTSWETRIAALGTLLFVLLLALIPTIQNFGTSDGSQIYDRLGSAVFEAAFARGTVPGCNGPEDILFFGRCGDIPVVTLFSRIIDFVNVLAGLGVGALIVGMILCLDTQECETLEDEAALLAENLRRMRQQLYLSGLILTFGMLFVTSWMNWPLQLVQDSERAAYGSVILSASLYMGTYFSLLILSFYLPVALLLDSRVHRLGEKATLSDKPREQLDIEAWKETHGLKEGASDYLRAGFALTAPILTAFAGGISPLVL